MVPPSRGVRHFAVEAEKPIDARMIWAFFAPILIAVVEIIFRFIGVGGCLIFIVLRFIGFGHIPMVNTLDYHRRRN